MRILFMKKLTVILGALLVTLLTLTLVIYPKEGVESAMAGLKVFWDIVLPSLLPFFILSEVMLGMGVVHFIGVLLEPLMRPLFNVPGVGAFALSMGLAAGYPMDAVITAKFRRSGLCTRIEGERLLSFTNTADPLFIFGAVAVGMFGRPELGLILGAAHYLSSFTVGIIFKYYHRKKGDVPGNPESYQEGIIKRAFRALFKARREDGRTFGKLMGDSVRESMMTLLMIGGFIIFFAVLVRILTEVGILGLLTPGLAGLLQLLGIDPNLTHAVFNGLLEIDLGTMATSKAMAPLLDKVLIAGFIIAWSGISVHGQVASVIHGTDIRMAPYVIGRLLHGLLAAWYTYLLMGPLSPVMAPLLRAVPVTAGFNPINRIVFSGKQLVLGFGILLGISLLVYLSRKYKLVYVKKTAGCKR